MTSFHFSISVPNEITTNEEWFKYISSTLRELAELYEDCAKDADNLQETHPFYAAMLPSPVIQCNRCDCREKSIEESQDFDPLDLLDDDDDDTFFEHTCDQEEDR